MNKHILKSRTKVTSRMTLYTETVKKHYGFGRTEIKAM